MLQVVELLGLNLNFLQEVSQSVYSLRMGGYTSQNSNRLQRPVWDAGAGLHCTISNFGCTCCTKKRSGTTTFHNSFAAPWWTKSSLLGPTCSGRRDSKSCPTESIWKGLLDLFMAWKKIANQRIVVHNCSYVSRKGPLSLLSDTCPWGCCPLWRFAICVGTSHLPFLCGHCCGRKTLRVLFFFVTQRTRDANRRCTVYT